MPASRIRSYRMQCRLRCQFQPQSCLVLLLCGVSGPLFQSLSIFVPEAVSGAADKDIFQCRLAYADRIDVTREGLNHISDKTMSSLALDAYATIIQYGGFYAK